MSAIGAFTLVSLSGELSQDAANAVRLIQLAALEKEFARLDESLNRILVTTAAFPSAAIADDDDLEEEDDLDDDEDFDDDDFDDDEDDEDEELEDDEEFEEDVDFNASVATHWTFNTLAPVTTFRWSLN